MRCDKKRKLLKLATFLLLTAVIVLCTVGVHAENIDPDSTGCKYAWSENAGWINFKPSQGPGVTVTGTAVTGMAWGENIGWINMSPTNYGGVVNDGTGNLSGYAWGENVGWINFKPTGGGASIGSDGKFTGYAWGENIGWINFSSANACVKTAWAPDTTPPTISLICPGTVNLNVLAYASVNVTDAGSGVASQSAPNGNNIVDTSTAGPKTYSVSAQDLAGNVASNSCSYRVVYDFTGGGGFLAPLEPPPTVNTAKAGATVPVKWMLPDGHGGYLPCDLAVVTSTTFREVECSSYTSDENPIPTPTAGNSGLQCNSGQYQFNWKTQKAMAGKCYQFILTLNDGSSYYANFALK